jgi:hypothetical protein
MRITLFMVIALHISSYMKGQPFAGMGVGYTTAKSPIFSLQAGYKLSKSLFYYNQLIHITTRASVPQILGIRYGYYLGSFQPNVGFDYYVLSSDKYKADKLEEGFHFAFGITKNFKNIPLKIDLGMSYKYIIACIGVYKIFENKIRNPAHELAYFKL